MRFKKLKSEEELEQYRNFFIASLQKGSGTMSSDLPLSYLRVCHVIGVFNHDHQMMAGYILGTNEPLRLLEFIPESMKSSLIVPFNCQWSDCCEVTCVWKLPEVSLIFMSAIFWPHALIGVLSSGKQILLGHNQNARLDKFYTGLGPATIYSGVSSFGLSSRLFAYNRWRVVICVFLFWIFETPRRLLKNIIKKSGAKNEL